MKLEGKLTGQDLTSLHLLARDNTLEGFMARCIINLNIEISRLKDLSKESKHEG